MEKTIKKASLSILIITVFLLLSGCAKHDEKVSEFQFLLIGAGENQNELAVKSLVVDENILKLSEMPLCVLSADTFDADSIRYWNSKRIVINQDNLLKNYDITMTVETVTAVSLLCDEYFLKKEQETIWSLSDSVGQLNQSVRFEDSGINYTPIVMTDSQDGKKLFFFCNNLSGTADQFRFAIFELQLSNMKMSVFSINEEMAEHEIIAVQYPFDQSVVSAAEDGFLYNEGTRVFMIDAQTREMKVLFEENRVVTDSPIMDSYRETYTFFSGTAYQNNSYLLAFPAYNEIRGWYIAIYTDTGIYNGCVRISDYRIQLFNAKNEQLDEITCDGYNEYYNINISD